MHIKLQRRVKTSSMPEAFPQFQTIAFCIDVITTLTLNTILRTAKKLHFEQNSTISRFEQCRDFVHQNNIKKIPKQKDMQELSHRLTF